MRRRLLSEINVVPYIDVMLVLLVIFMVTAPLLTQGVSVKLPQAHSKSLSAQNKIPIIISIDNRGDYFLNDSQHPETPLSIQTLINRTTILLAAAQKNHEQREVYIKGDKNVTYDKVVRLMVLLQHSGVNHVGLITENPSQSK